MVLRSNFAIIFANILLRLMTISKKIFPWLLVGLFIAGCSAPYSQTPTALYQLAQTPSSPTSTPAAPTSTEARPTTSVPSLTPKETPTQVATQLTPFVTGPSESLMDWSPDAHWVPYIDFTTETLHFYDVSNASTCDFPSAIHYLGPDHFLVWLPDGRVVVQAAEKAMAGLPCGVFSAATPQEMLVLAHADPSFSPDGRYQVIEEANSNSQGPNLTVSIKEIASGKTLTETTFIKLAQGGGSITGYWLDESHFLVPSTGDQGPLLLVPGEPVVQVAVDIFRQPLKPASGEYDTWMARSNEGRSGSPFHLLLIPAFGSSNTEASNPLQIYHSESGKVETLPYLISQGTFSSDGHWLLVTAHTEQGDRVLIRPVDPPGSAFQPFNSPSMVISGWSPDGSMRFQVDTERISLFSTSNQALLGVWQASGYELYPSWSPDGKYLSVWGRNQNNYNQESIFVIPVKDH
jgi:hypothetical protein